MGEKTLSRTGRYETIYTVEADGRDKGKSFHITEMPCAQAEKWAWRVFIALARSGVALPMGLRNAGMAGLSALDASLINNSAFVNMQWPEVEPLIDELMSCVAAITPAGSTRALVPSDTQEIKTRLMLRLEAFIIHTSFTSAGALLSTIIASAETNQAGQQNPPTSPQPSPKSSEADTLPSTN